MHIVINKSQHGKKIYNSVLLRESYRENGKVKKRTIANLSACSDKEVAAIRLGVCRTYQFRKKWLPNLRFKNVKTFLNSLVPIGRICCHNSLILFK